MTKRCKICDKIITGTNWCQRCYLKYKNPMDDFELRYKAGKTWRNKKNLKQSERMKGKNHPLFGKEGYWKNKKRPEISKKNKGKGNPMFGKITHGKWKKYKNIWMRSSWEVAYAKWLDKNSIKWLYEPKSFNLGNTTYRPDFYLPKLDIYIEIKGYWRDDAKRKFELFKKKYSKLNIRVLLEKDLQKIGAI